MRALRVWFRRLAGLVDRNGKDREFAEELEAQGSRPRSWARWPSASARTP